MVLNFTGRRWVQKQGPVPDHTGANGCLWGLLRQSCSRIFVCLGHYKFRVKATGEYPRAFNEKHTDSL